MNKVQKPGDSECYLYTIVKTVQNLVVSSVSGGRSPEKSPHKHCEGNLACVLLTNAAVYFYSSHMYE
jgi:hypothetical protein